MQKKKNVYVGTYPAALAFFVVGSWLLDEECLLGRPVELPLLPLVSVTTGLFAGGDLRPGLAAKKIHKMKGHVSVTTLPEKNLMLTYKV